MVSVPYRGATFLNVNMVYVRFRVMAFPSPIGELHFSILRYILTFLFYSVSVPYRGATFLNTDAREQATETARFRPLSGSYISQLSKTR